MQLDLVVNDAELSVTVCVETRLTGTCDHKGENGLCNADNVCKDCNMEQTELESNTFFLDTRARASCGGKGTKDFNQLEAEGEECELGNGEKKETVAGC